MIKKGEQNNMNRYHKKNIFTLKLDDWAWVGECLYDHEYEGFIPSGKGTMTNPDQDVYRGRFAGCGNYDWCWYSVIFYVCQPISWALERVNRLFSGGRL